MKFAATLTGFTLLASASGFRVAPPTRLPSRPKTSLNENFGLNLPNLNDTDEITPDLLLGEAKYKQWVGEIEDNSFLNRQYNVLERVREVCFVCCVLCVCVCADVAEDFVIPPLTIL